MDGQPDRLPPFHTFVTGEKYADSLTTSDSCTEPVARRNTTSFPPNPWRSPLSPLLRPINYILEQEEPEHHQWFIGIEISNPSCCACYTIIQALNDTCDMKFYVNGPHHKVSFGMMKYPNFSTLKDDLRKATASETHRRISTDIKLLQKVSKGLPSASNQLSRASWLSPYIAHIARIYEGSSCQVIWCELPKGTLEILRTHK